MATQQNGTSRACWFPYGPLMLGLCGLAGCTGVLGGEAPGPVPEPADAHVDGLAGPAPDGGVGQPDLHVDTRPGADRGLDLAAKPDSAPPPRPLPDVSAAKVNCSTWVVGDKAQARKIYDSYFGPLRPKSAADFKWTVDPKLLSPGIVTQVAFHAPSQGQGNAAYHDLFDFNPNRYSRTTTQANQALFGTFDPKQKVDAPYRQYNPTDYVPATMTHYARGTTSDVIATQFVLRVACMKPQMKKALAACPDCNDAIVMLSKNDAYKVFDVRFARVSGGKLEVSRRFRMVSVDCSGNMVSHSQVAPYYYGSVGGQTLRAKWRGEISGYMAQTLGTYMKPTPILVRLSKVSPGY